MPSTVWLWGVKAVPSQIDQIDFNFANEKGLISNLTSWCYYTLLLRENKVFQSSSGVNACGWDERNPNRSELFSLPRFRSLPALISAFPRRQPRGCPLIKDVLAVKRLTCLICCLSSGCVSQVLVSSFGSNGWSSMQRSRQEREK